MFIPITSEEIASGKPTSTVTFNKIKSNLEDLDARITTAELSSTAYTPIIFRVNGSYSKYGLRENVVKTTSNFSFNFSGVRVIADKAGTSGSLEIDILYKRGTDPYVSIFTTKPSVSYTAGDDAISTNAVLDVGTFAIEAGDIIRLDITSIQDNAEGFLVRCDYTRG